MGASLSADVPLTRYNRTYVLFLSRACKELRCGLDFRNRTSATRQEGSLRASVSMMNVAMLRVAPGSFRSAAIYGGSGPQGTKTAIVKAGHLTAMMNVAIFIHTLIPTRSKRTA